MTITDRTWDTLPPEIHARVMAATAHAETRRIEHVDGHWTVNAVAGDRFVHQVLGLRGDGSVSEATRTVLTADILEISLDDNGATLVVDGPSGPEEIRIPASIGQALNRHNEGELERSVKGIGQGIAGRFKEIAGELIDDPALEEAGITQQMEGKIRRAEVDNSS